MSERKLASIQRVVDIKSIENADKIELVFVQGWQVVCKRGEFHIGDLVVYVEIDSLMPEKLLKLSNFWDNVKNKGMLDSNSGNRVRTRKFRGALSQGLVLHLSVLENYI